MTDFPRDAFEENIRLIKRENDRLYPGLKIADVRWISKVKGKKDYSLLMMEVASAEYTNYIIIEGMIYYYDLKLIKIYNSAVYVI